MAQYRLGMRYQKILTYDISQILMKGPALPIFTTAISAIKSDETKTYTLDSSSCAIESVVGTNVTCEYDQSAKTLTLSDPTGPVSLTFVTYYNEDNLCWLYLSKVDRNGLAAWPNRGTISYIDKYDSQKTINVADLDWSGRFWRSLDVKVGCDVVCTNIGVGLSSAQKAVLQFSNTDATSDHSVTVTASSTASYTFKNVVKVPGKNQADVRITTTL